MARITCNGIYNKYIKIRYLSKPPRRVAIWLIFPLFAPVLPQPCRNRLAVLQIRDAAKLARQKGEKVMKKERRWLKSALMAAAREEVFLPWAMRRAGKCDTALPHMVRKTPQTPAAFPFAIAAR